jgi:hypothetical protein
MDQPTLCSQALAFIGDQAANRSDLLSFNQHPTFTTKAMPQKVIAMGEQIVAHRLARPLLMVVVIAD